MSKNPDILARLEKLEARNKRVEADKAWERSWYRRASVMLLTYLVVAIYLRVVVHIDPWINALVPVIGFGLSTLTLTFIKKEWLSKRITKK
jgi:hypothetical protein